MKKIILLLFSCMAPFIMSMEQKQNSTINSITTESLRSDDLSRYVEAVKNNRIEYANRIAEVCRIHVCDALIYTYQHEEQRNVYEMLVPLVQDPTKALTYFIQTDQCELATAFIQNPKIPCSINYFSLIAHLELTSHAPQFGQAPPLKYIPYMSLLDLIVAKRNYPLLHACSIHTPSKVARGLSRRLAKALCNQNIVNQKYHD